MPINLEADYAVRIVHFLARSEMRMDAKSISEGTSVSLRFTLKIMRKLVSGGIVKSYKGVRGGYILAKPAREITLRQVIEAADGPYRFSRCLEEGYACQRSSGADCPFQKVFKDVTKLVTDRLDQTTFDTLI